jgi:hypothetical protein
MSERWCSGCGQMFSPRPQSPRQAYCSNKSCQVARKLLWQKTKRKSDHDYAENQKKAAAAWAQRNPDHWQHARKAKKQGTDQAIESSSQLFKRLIASLLKLFDHASSQINGYESVRRGRFPIPLLCEITIAQAGEPAVTVTMRVEFDLQLHTSSPETPQETT